MTVVKVPGEGAVRQPRAVAIGVFDGVHLGHRAVLRHVLEAERAVPVVLTFADSPRALPKKAEALFTEEEKRRQLELLGIRELWEMEFGAVRELSPEQFVRQILRDAMQARTVCCGENFRFGYGGAGDAALLTALCEAEGIRVTVAPTLCVEGQPVSSSRIRALLREGELLQVNRLLGAPFTVTAPVRQGRHLGRTLGFPTVNQEWPQGVSLPRRGVYLSCVEVDGRVHTGVTNIGLRPTVDGTRPTAETHIFGFDGELYGQTLSVRPIRFLREERRFESVEALQRQVTADLHTAREAVAPTGAVRAVLFDFDDTLQNRPEAFRRYAEAFVCRHFPQLPERERAVRARTMWERNGNGHAYTGAQEYISYDAYFAGLIREWDWREAPPVAELKRECNLWFAGMTAPFEDAEATLRALRDDGLLTGCVTNGNSSMQHRKLEVSGLMPLLDALLVSGDEGVHKPDPELFRRAAARLGVAPEDCLFVGDHPVNDLAGAAGAGMRVLYPDLFGLHAAGPDIPAVNRLSEIPAYVRADATAAGRTDRSAEYRSEE